MRRRVIFNSGDSAIGRTALVFECNHHPLSRIEAFEASPAALAAVVASDLVKAIGASRFIVSRGLLVDGQQVAIDVVLPIAVLPEALPIGDLTAIRFRQELSKSVEGLNGEALKIRPSQILSQNHFEYFDQVWHLPQQVSELVSYLEGRASTEPTRFGPINLDARKIKAVHSGNTWGKVHEAEQEEFRRIGPTRFGAAPENPGRNET